MTNATLADAPGSLWDHSSAYGFGRIRSGGQAGIGIGTTHPTPTDITKNLLVCGSREVALIDRLVFQGMTNDAATNHTIVVRVNNGTSSVDMPIHLSGTANIQRSERLVWNTRGSLVIPPGGYLSCVSPTYTAQTRATVSGRYRMMNVQKAAELGYFNGGTMPACASTFTVDEDPVVADESQQLIAPLAGHYVEILGFTYTGHNFSATLGNNRLGFWDGTTGSDFDTGGVTIFRGYNQGVSGVYQSRVLVGNTHGCIQGPVGYGVYLQATATLVSSGDLLAAYNVIYRYRKATDCANNTGASITTGGRRWWRYTQGITSPVDQTAIFGAGAPTCGVKVLGQAGTLCGGASSDSTPVATMTLDTTNGWGEEFCIEGDGADSPGPTSLSWSIDDDVMVCNSAQVPGMTAANANNVLTARSHLCWGMMTPNRNTINIASQSGKNIRNAWSS